MLKHYVYNNQNEYTRLDKEYNNHLNISFSDFQNGKTKNTMWELDTDLTNIYLIFLMSQLRQDCH